MYIEKNIPVLISSKSATNSNADRSTCQLVFSRPIQIPNEAVNVEVAATQFYGQNTFRNIPQASAFVFTTNVGTHTVPLPAGCYTLDAFSEAVEFFLSETAALPDRLFTFTRSTATGIVSVDVDGTGSSDGTVVDLLSVAIPFASNAANAPIATLLGFTSDKTVAVTNGRSDVLQGDTVATIDDTPHMLNVHTDLTHGAMDAKGNPSTLLLSVPISVPLGASIAYQPSEPIFHECSSDSSNITSIIATLREHDESILAPFSDWWVQIDIRYQLYVDDDTNAALHGKGYALN